MKNIILIISMLAIIVGCDNGRISIKEGKLYFCNEKVGEFTPCTQTGVRFEDAVERIDDNILKVTRTFTAEENIDSVRLTFDFCHAYKCQQVIIPSVCYNGNHWGRGKEPKASRQMTCGTHIPTAAHQSPEQHTPREKSLQWQCGAKSRQTKQKHFRAA